MEIKGNVFLQYPILVISGSSLETIQKLNETTQKLIETTQIFRQLLNLLMFVQTLFLASHSVTFVSSVLLRYLKKMKDSDWFMIKKKI